MVVLVTGASTGSGIEDLLPRAGQPAGAPPDVASRSRAS